MAFFYAIPRRVFRLVPAIFFAAIGIFDIVSDALAQKLAPPNVLFNLILFIPLLIDRKTIHIICGIIALAFSLYAGAFLFVCFIKYTQGAHFTFFFDTFVVAPIFIGLTFICSLSLIYAGTIPTKKPTIA